jgi:hypothetical protein
MPIVTIGIDLAKNVFAIHGVDEAGKAMLIKPRVPRDQLARLIAQGSVAETRRVSCVVTIRTIGHLMKTLNPAVARVLKRLHYPLDVILTCVRWYVAYPLSLRHLEEMMAERGISVDHSTVHRWAIKVLPVLEKAFRRHKKAVGRSWRMDESVSRTQAKACGAVLKMGVGLLEPACRSRLQTARCCCVQKAWW